MQNHKNGIGPQSVIAIRKNGRMEPALCSGSLGEFAPTTEVGRPDKAAGSWPGGGRSTPVGVGEKSAAARRQLNYGPHVAKTILVVDDEVAVRRLFRIALSGEGFEVLEAGNGQEALNLVLRAVPAVILLDLVMPGVEGIETLVALRRLGVTSKIVAMSGKPQYLSAAKLIGADEALLKPISIDELKATVRGLLE